LSCPFAGMTRIRFKGFFSAHRAPLGTMFNVCAGVEVSMTLPGRAGRAT
jgi:hypothetical protein